MERPNILYLHSHDTGRYIEPYGYAVPTPNLQRLAEEGVLFRQAFSAAPTCSPSRAALLTGQSPHNSGMLGLAHRGFALRDVRQHLVHTLKAAGYTTALSGVQHVASNANAIGYDRVLTTGERDVVPQAVEFLKNPPSVPFFLDCGFFVTHREFPEPSSDDDPRYVRPPAPLPDTPETRRDFASFRTSARTLDRCIGEVLDALDASRSGESTLVICTTDHGLAFPDMKCHLTDHGIGVFLIVRGPGGFVDGQVCDALVSHLDVFPTVCDVAGIEPPAWLQGASLAPLVRGEVAAVREQITAEVTYHAAYEPQRAVRTKRWKYIRRYANFRTPNLPNCDDSLSKDVWLAHGWRERPVDAEQLYDLVFDPNERRNLMGVDGFDDVTTEMRRRLDDWMTSTGDPLLTGPVPAPSGSAVNDPRGLSPREPTQRIP
jgi:arylsulfatase A-like enzyme